MFSASDIDNKHKPKTNFTCQNHFTKLLGLIEIQGLFQNQIFSIHAAKFCFTPNCFIHQDFYLREETYTNMCFISGQTTKKGGGGLTPCTTEQNPNFSSTEKMDKT